MTSDKILRVSTPVIAARITVCLAFVIVLTGAAVMFVLLLASFFGLPLINPWHAIYILGSLGIIGIVAALGGCKVM